LDLILEEVLGSLQHSVESMVSNQLRADVHPKV
jgi:hypothetical protein